MKTLLDDYKRKLSTVEEFIKANKNNGSMMDEQRKVRLDTKASELRSFIVDIERAIKRDPNIENKQCSAGLNFSDCHIHADNISGCLDCGNFEKQEEDVKENENCLAGEVFMTCDFARGARLGSCLECSSFIE